MPHPRVRVKVKVKDKAPPSSHPSPTLWQQRVQEWYPGRRGQARNYFLFPVYMNRTQHQEVTLPGHTDHVTQPPVSDLPRDDAPVLQEIDVRDDRSQRRVLDALHELSEAQREVMFVISQLIFGDYLNKPTYSATGRG